MPMSITDTRVANIRALIEEMGSQASFCRRFNLNPTYISQLLNGHRTFGERAARKIEAKLGVPPGWLDRLQTGEGPMEPPAQEPAPRGSRKAVELADEIMALSSEGKLSDEAVAAIEQLVRTMSGD